MTKIYSYSARLDQPLCEAFWASAPHFSDQFAYYDKKGPSRLFGLGRCIALRTLVDCEVACSADFSPRFFSFNRFDEASGEDENDLFSVFPHLSYLLPELVLFEHAGQAYFQVNSLGPVHSARIRYLKELCVATQKPHAYTSSLAVEPDDVDVWRARVNQALSHIQEGSLEKIVLTRRQAVRAQKPFSSRDLVMNLINEPTDGVVVLYRYGNTLFCGCTPEKLFKKEGKRLQSMCLAGTCPHGSSPKETQALAEALLADTKNRREHDYVVHYLRHALARCCSRVDIPAQPSVMCLSHVQHLYTPVEACLLEGWSSQELVKMLAPTPALSGAPVGAALCALRNDEPFNRGFFGGACGWVDASDNAEFCVAIRSGVFEGREGYIYAGCGIVKDSNPDAEYEETKLKFQTMISAFRGCW